MALHVYNTLTRTLEEFVPLQEGHVGMYVCGPTVYDHSHLGHGKSYVSFDVIVRYLRFLGYAVRYVQNITDVGHLTDDADMGEDKIERVSRTQRIHPMQIVETFTRSYFEDMDALNVLRPDISPRATGHIIEQVEIIRRLLEAGHAYEAGGSVYFDVPRFSTYGKLSGRTVDELLAGARVEVDPGKRHPADFALWKKATPGHIMRWPSPWGEGFPGWHIECSAMSMKYLGESFDIHGGGLENQFPHHECEIAQSEASTGRPFVKYWLHNNMVTLNGRKMSKSLGNTVSLKDAFRTWGARVVRFFILQSHYRSTLDFSNDAVEGASRGLEKLDGTLQRVDDRLAHPHPGDGGARRDLEHHRRAFLEAMDDDFNTPRAIAVLFDLARDVNQLLSGEAPIARETLEEIRKFYDVHAGQVLGMEIGRAGEVTGRSLEDGLLNLLASLRRELRAQKLWPLADRIRHELAALGVTMEDGKEGTTWKRTS